MKYYMALDGPLQHTFQTLIKKPTEEQEHTVNIMK